MHIPQSWQTFVELEKICLVEENIISPGTSRPIITVEQDTLVGAYLLTIRDIKLTKDKIYNLMTFMNNYKGYLPEPAGYEYNQPYWTGKQMYSLILPDISINQLKNIKIIRGNITEGYLSKDSLGNDPAGLIKQIYNAYGMKECGAFLNNTQKLITKWFADYGFSIGFGDAIISKDKRLNIKSIMNEYMNKVYEVIQKAQHGVYANDLDDMYKALKIDEDISELLSILTDKVKEYLFSVLPKTNNFYIAGDKGAGSKGDVIHTVQTIACVGQQSIWGKRIEEGFTERTLPHFPRNDIGPDAKGFCRNSFIEGLTPSETFFAAMGGRVGSIDTAIKTADSGYLSRKLIKATEDLMVNYDMTIRNASNNIVQFSYGDDNCDPIKIEKISRIEMIEYNDKKMSEQYKFELPDSREYFETFMTKEAIDEMMEDINYKNIINDEYEELLDMRKEMRYNYFKNVEAIGDIQTYIPINLYRVIPSQLIQFNVKPFDLTDLTPQYIIKSFKDVVKEIVRYLPEKEQNWKLYKIIFKSFLASKKVLKEYRMSKAAFDSVILMIREKMVGALVSPGEMIGVIGAQTLGEISTQLTLNSVTYETEIIVRDSNKKICKYQIGDFIEREIKCSEKIEYMAEKDTTYAECKEYFEIPTGDVDGNVTWERIEAVTRHPVINKDGSNTMLKFTTEDEREVIVTKAKSLLKLVDGKIIERDGDTFKVGDYLPVSTKQIDFEETFELNLKEILPPNEYLYGSELEKAKKVIKEYQWWKNHSNKTFVLPHKRSDSVVILVSDKPRNGSAKNTNIQDGCVYMLLSNMTEYRIPEKIPMNYNFGYLIGAYMAEGCMTKHQLSIANNDSDYFGPILELCKEWNITTKIYRHENKNKERWTSQDIRIYNTLLCRILDNLCGKLSHNKFVSDKIIYSNKECLRGLLDAYIGGDGCVDSRSCSIRIGSVSKPMLIDVQNILLNFGIYSRIYKQPLRTSNNRGSKDIKQGYSLCVENKQARKLAEIIDMKIGYKKEATEQILKHTHKYEFGKKHLNVPNEIDGIIVMEPKGDRFKDVVFDKIKSIEEVPNTTPYAYDLTVEKTRNFTINNAIILRDTFHFSGTSASSVVTTESIPRLREIINVSKNMKNSIMTIYLKDQYSNDKNEAKKIQSKFAYTQLKDILAKTEILYDNKNGFTEMKEDIEFIRSYKEFSELFDIDNIDETEMSPWILRLTFDKESLMNKKITIQDIQEIIKINYHNDKEIDCVYSDDSANDIIMRIQIKQDTKGVFMENIKEFEKQLVELTLRGITNIRVVEAQEGNIIKYSDDGTMIPSKEWLLKTNGTNILDVMADDAVDITRTYTNDIIEFFEIFGIEATRELIYREMYQVYASKHPNPRHIQMMADIMTYRGKLMPIDRHGLNKNPESGPIAKACFEEVMNIFTKAAVFSEKDNMKGVSANILAGQFCKSGTNAFEILIDEDKLIESSKLQEYDETEIIDINEKDVDKAFDNAYKSSNKVDDVAEEDFTFGFGMEKNKQFNIEQNISTGNADITFSNKNNVSISNDLSNININNVQKYDIITNEQKETLKNNTEEVENESEFNIDIEEPTYESEMKNEIENVKNEDDELFGNIDIEEPNYTENKPIKIKVKKIKETPEEKEEKPKKKTTKKTVIEEIKTIEPIIEEIKEEKPKKKIVKSKK